MVERYETELNRDGGALIVDLDGTWCKANTLHLFTKTAFKYNLQYCRWHRALAIFFWVTMRKLRLVSHTGMRRRILRNAGINNDLLDHFKGKVLHRVNHRVAKIVRRHRKAKIPVLLATAAADSYVWCLWDGDYLASPLNGPEMRGEVKRDNVIEWLKKHNLKPGMVITDHHDDIPLAEYAVQNGADVVLVSPSGPTLQKFSEKGIDFSIL